MTPPYSHLTGGLLEDKSQNNDSSSSSESESSHGSSHQGRYESHFNGRSSSAGIRMNKDEKLAREAGIKLNIKVDFQIFLSLQLFQKIHITAGHS